MEHLITIVIPCKNEKNIILKTLDLLNYQKGIKNTRVIVCDSSDDGITNPHLRERIKNRKRDNFILEMTDGGFPSVARNIGFSLVKTPYVLFLDADVFLLDPGTIDKTLRILQKRDLDLVTVKFRSDSGKYNYVYRTFDVIQILSKWLTPFCLGGFMLIKSETFRSLGGFDEEIKIAEDYQLSKKIRPKKFGRVNNVVFTPPRRFEKKGIIYMLRIMVGSFFNRSNKKWFTEDKNYWG